MKNKKLANKVWQFGKIRQTFLPPNTFVLYGNYLLYDYAYIIHYKKLEVAIYSIKI